MNENYPDSQPSFGERLANAFVVFLSAILRLLAILVLGVALGAIFYFGVPNLYRQVIEPIQENANQLQTLSTLQSQDKEEITQRLGSLTVRIEDLENQSDSNKEALDSLEAQLSEEIDLQKSSLSEMESRLESSMTSLDNLQGQLSNLLASYKSLSKEVTQTTGELESLKSENTAQETPLVQLRDEVRTLKVMELLTRSRLYIIQRNFGLAERDVRAAREILVEIRATAPNFRTETMQSVLTRLDLALENLPNTPNLADDDLEVAWQVLAGIQSIESFQATLTPLEATELPVTATSTSIVTQPVSATPELTTTPTP